MNAAAIIIIAVAATGVLMMRFRKRWLAKINIAFTNRITSIFAGWLPGFGILTHVGRKSGLPEQFVRLDHWQSRDLANFTASGDLPESPRPKLTMRSTVKAYAPLSKTVLYRSRILECDFGCDSPS
jgi:hypothetical protein